MKVSGKIALLLGIGSLAVLGITEAATAQSIDSKLFSTSEQIAIAETRLFALPISSSTDFTTLTQATPFVAQTPELETEEEVEIEETEVEIEDTETDEGVAGLGIVSPGGNYIGVGGSLGFVEDAYGDFGAAALISKFELFSLNENNDISVRPSVLVGQDVTFVVPFTIDVLLGDPDPEIWGRTFIPYGGPGFTFTTDTDIFYFTLTGGLDIPFDRFTMNVETNVGFLDDLAWGLMLGIGYNF